MACRRSRSRPVGGLRVRYSASTRQFQLLNTYSVSNVRAIATPQRGALAATRRVVLYREVQFSIDRRTPSYQRRGTQTEAPGASPTMRPQSPAPRRGSPVSDPADGRAGTVSRWMSIGSGQPLNSRR
jgi:hypothetical protein